MEIVRSAAIRLDRNMDGKGRVILPGDLREAGHFAPDEPVTVTLITYQTAAGKTRHGFLITRQCDADPEEEPPDPKKYGHGHRIKKQEGRA